MLRPEQSTRRAAAAARRRPWLDHALVLLALAVLLQGYTAVVVQRDWWFTTVLVAGLVAVVCAVLGAVAPRWAVPAGLLVEVLVLGWIFVPETFVGVAPTWGTLESLAAMLSRAQVLIMEEAAPAAAARPIVLVLAGSFGLLVLVAELLLRRRFGVMAVGALLVAVLVAPALVSGTTPPLWMVLVPAAAWLALVRTRTPGTSSGWAGLAPACALGAMGLLAAALVPPVMPDVTAVAKPWGDPPPEVFGRGINPMLQLGQNLRRNSTVVSASYTTDLQDPPYLKVAVLRDFTGKTWRPARSRSGDPFESQVNIDPDIAVEPAETMVQILDLRSSMLPVPYPATEVSGLEGAWTWHRVGQTVSSTTSTTDDQRYTVTSLDRQPTAEQMRALRTTIGPSLRSYVALPDDVPPVLGRTARQVTAGATNDYDRALALQDHLRENFLYSETAPVADDYDGNGMAVLETFLEAKAGYCVHFSSAMAVMARELGIPARVAVGYAPGEAADVTDDGDTIYAVTSDDLHAWPELYFEGVGWIGFEPTPGVGSRTGFVEPVGSTPDVTEDTLPNEAPDEAPDSADEAPGAVAPEELVEDEAPTSMRAAATVGGVALLSLVVPGGLRAWQRRRRLAADDAEAWWREIEASAVDAGREVHAAATARAVAHGLENAADAADLARVVTAVELTRYARPGADVADERAAAARVVGAVRADGSRLDRLRARFLPRSLLRR